MHNISCVVNCSNISHDSTTSYKKNYPIKKNALHKSMLENNVSKKGLKSPPEQRNLSIDG